jgi:hypothetical protein
MITPEASLSLSLVLAATLGLAAACTGRSGSSSTPPGPTGEKWLDAFPAYPGARRLCSQSINACPSHVLWTAYATTDAFDLVVRFYEQHRNARPFEKADDGHWTLRGTDGKLVSIHPKDGKYPTCDVAPAAGARSVLIVSQMMGSGHRP